MMGAKLTPRNALDIVLAVFWPIARRYHAVPEHWVGGDHDQSLSYCRRCCEREVRTIKRAEPSRDVYVDGGWPMEADGLAFCSNEKCGRPLDVNFTDYAVESELQHFGEYPFDAASPFDCASLIEMISSGGWQWRERSRKIRALAFRALRSVPRRTVLRRIRVQTPK